MFSFSFQQNLNQLQKNGGKSLRLFTAPFFNILMGTSFPCVPAGFNSMGTAPFPRHAFPFEMTHDVVAVCKHKMSWKNRPELCLISNWSAERQIICCCFSADDSLTRRTCCHHSLNFDHHKLSMTLSTWLRPDFGGSNYLWLSCTITRNCSRSKVLLVLVLVLVGVGLLKLKL